MHRLVCVCARLEVIQALHQVLRILVATARVAVFAIVIDLFSWSKGVGCLAGVLVEFGKNLSILGAMTSNRSFVREVAFSHLVMPAWVDPVFLEELCLNCTPGLFGIILSASNRLAAKAGSIHHGLSIPGLLPGMERLDMGPLSFLVFGRSCQSFFHVQVTFAVLIIAAFDTIGLC